MVFFFLSYFHFFLIVWISSELKRHRMRMPGCFCRSCWTFFGNDGANSKMWCRLQGNEFALSCSVAMGKQARSEEFKILKGSCTALEKEGKSELRMASLLPHRGKAAAARHCLRALFSACSWKCALGNRDLCLNGNPDIQNTSFIHVNVCIKMQMWYLWLLPPYWATV